MKRYEVVATIIIKEFRQVIIGGLSVFVLRRGKAIATRRGSYEDMGLGLFSDLKVLIVV